MSSRRDFLSTLAITGTAAALGSPKEVQAATRRPGPIVERAPKPLRILILGGTGLTGPFQVRYALERGHTVTVFNRGRRNERLPKGVTELKGDRQLGQIDALKGKDWDVVLDNPTTLPFWVRDVGAILKDHTNHYIFTSTISVYDPAGAREISEDSKLLEYTEGDPLAVTQQMMAQRFEFFYGRMKTASEREARKWFGERTTIIRPGLIVGPGDGTFRFTYWPHRIAQGGEVLVPGDGADPIQIIDSRDIAEWTIRVAEERHLGTFNATGPASPMSMAEMVYGIRAAFDATTQMSFTWVPAEFLAQHQVAPWQEMTTWIPRTDPEHILSKTRIDRALAAGLTFRPLATTSQDALKWFRDLPEATRAQVGKAAGLAPDKEKQVLAAWGARSK